jgi:hypothetical protein
MNDLLPIFSEGIIAIVSYILALKLYKLCNNINTTPVLQVEPSGEAGL